MQHEQLEKLRSNEQAIAWNVLLNSPAVRMLETIGAPDWIRSGGFARDHARNEAVERHDDYFRRRSGEERLAARKAGSGAARQAHNTLADLYWRMADALKTPTAGRSRHVERREAHLDGALDDTFPASDPVSIVIPDRRERFQ